MATTSSKQGKTALSITLLLCFALLTSACSSRLSYNFLDWWMSWQVRQHISLDRDQRRQVRNHIQAFHQWHRETQLPRYATFLERALAQLETNEADEKMLQKLFDEAESLWRDSINWLLPPTTELLAGLSDRQVRELLDNLQKTQKDWQARAAKRSNQERAKDNAERWIGHLTERQQDWVDRWVDTVKPTAEESADTQARWLAQLEQALNLRSDPDRLAKELEQLLLGDEQLYTEDYRKKLAHNRQHTLALVAQINNNLSREQQQQRREAFTGYIEDFRSWAGVN